MTTIETADVPQCRLNLQPTATSAWLVLALLVVIGAPLFVCMPLSDDVALYDLQARTLLDGGMLYRDVFEPNLPGVVWVQAGIRSLLGYSTEAMRITDLFLFAAIVFFLARWVRAMGRPTGVQAWAAVVLVLFYLSISEWNHCQRDVWLLVPALGALHLRRLQTERIAAAESSGWRIAGWALVEGLCWGAGVWLKPMVVVPAAACWLVSAMATRRVRPIGADLVGLLLGGLLVGCAGVAWLVGSGAWPYFWETFVQWNPRYFAAGKENWTAGRFVSMCFRFFPWILLHLVAVPVAVSQLVRGLLRQRDDHKTETSTQRSAALLFAAFYLAWLGQSFLLQHLFDYVHAPGMMLAVAVLATVRAGSRSPMISDAFDHAPNSNESGYEISRRSFPAWRPAVMSFLVIAVLVSPLLRQERLACWPTCVTQGSSPEVQTKLARLGYPNWIDVDRVAAYLKQLDLKDGELTCFNNDMVSLYLKLGLRPPSRYVYLESLMAYFPEERAMFLQSVVDSPQRYIVADLTSTRLPDRIINAQGPDGELSLPPGFPNRARKMFPWRYPIVFRAGTLLVHRVEPPSPSTPAMPPQMATAQSSAPTSSSRSPAARN